MAAPPDWAPHLLAKYAEMLRLRRGDLDGTIAEPRADLRRLSESFPGALRELDEMPLDELARRVWSLEALSRGSTEPEPWGLPLARYHALLRGALSAKRWLGRRRHVDDQARPLFEREASIWGGEALAWSGELGRLARPEGGRLVALVIERLSVELGLDRGELEALLFPYGKRRRPRPPRGGEGARGRSEAGWVGGSLPCKSVDGPSPHAGRGQGAPEPYSAALVLPEDELPEDEDELPEDELPEDELPDEELPEEPLFLPVEL